MRHDLAKQIANGVLGRLRPLCVRAEIAGSIRRQKPEVKDIEIVCIPHPEKILEFGSLLYQVGPAIKGNYLGKYMQIVLPSGINLDLFMATMDNWGYIYAIRTGSAEYSHKVLATGWVKAGYRGEEGSLVNASTGEIVHVREEEDLFQLIGIPWTKPWEREA